jgi:hypothetical protein
MSFGSFIFPFLIMYLIWRGMSGGLSSMGGMGGGGRGVPGQRKSGGGPFGMFGQFAQSTARIINKEDIKVGFALVCFVITSTTYDYFLVYFVSGMLPGVRRRRLKLWNLLTF